MTQKTLAKTLGVHHVYLNAVLKGRAVPSVSLARKLAKITGKPFFELRPDLKKLVKEFL